MSAKNSGFILLFVFVLIEVFFLYYNFFRLNRADTIPNDVSFTSVVSKKPTDTLQNSFSLILTGDIMLGRNVRNESVKAGDFFYPFNNVAEILRGVDVVFANLESPSVSDCPIINEGFVFCSPRESLDALKNAWINVVSLANNHSLNFGQKGLEETKKFLNERGILFTGDGISTVKQVDGLTFGFLGFDFTVRQPNEKDYSLIEKLSREVNFLVVAPHWGVEYEDKPRDFQRSWAKEMVRRGADIIVGNHPHWVQGAECFENGESVGYTETGNLENFECLNGKVPVYYALGNFIFDQMWSEETKKGTLVELTINNGKIMEQKVKRTYIKNPGQPVIVD